jgi:hypothetical protein
VVGTRAGRLIAASLTAFAASGSIAVSDAAAADRLPDLGMAPLSDFKVDRLGDGRRVLRYSTTIVNVGSGAFELGGQRSATGETQIPVVQRVYGDDGTRRDVSTTAVMVYGGDGHNHWHVRDLESSELVRLDNGAKVGTGAKRGFCFWDITAYRLTLPGAPRSAAYGSSGCGTASSLDIAMGLSVGWGDIYPATLPDQYIDISGLAAGRYRLVVTADGGDWFSESSETNNTTWVELQLKGNGQPRVTAYGPAA